MRSTRLLTVFIAFALSFSLSSFAETTKTQPETSVESKTAAKTDSPAEKKTTTIKTEAATEKFEEVTLLSGATLEVDGTKSELKTVSHGLRKKAVFGLVPVRVYVLELLAANSTKLDKTEDGVLKSLPAAGPVLLHITFLRDLPGSKISDAFKDGLETNGIKTLTPELEKVLKEISTIKEFKKNESFSIAVSWKDKEATVYMQQTGSEIKNVAGGPEFAENFLSIWFGKPSDGRLGDLKKELIR